MQPMSNVFKSMIHCECEMVNRIERDNDDELSLKTLKIIDGQYLRNYTSNDDRKSCMRFYCSSIQSAALTHYVLRGARRTIWQSRANGSLISQMQSSTRSNSTAASVYDSSTSVSQSLIYNTTNQHSTTNGDFNDEKTVATYTSEKRMRAETSDALLSSLYRAYRACTVEMCAAYTSITYRAHVYKITRQCTRIRRQWRT